MARVLLPFRCVLRLTLREEQSPKTAPRRADSGRDDRDPISPDALTKLAADLQLANRRLEAAQRQLHQLATTDPLTGCHNRRFFDEIIAHEVQRHHRYGIPLTLVFIDVDRFKSVNDNLGHPMGDRLMQHLALLLKRHVRCADYVFRWGGDEFVVLMSCCEREAKRKSAKLKSAFGASVRRWALPPGVGLSIGCAQLGQGAPDIESLIREADTRMYTDKASRRTTVRANHEMQAPAQPDASVA